MAWPAAKLSLLLVLPFLAQGLTSTAPAAERTDSSAEGRDFFERKIRPLFVERCYECHSAEAKKLKGGLRFDLKDGVLKGGDSGPAVLPGDPEKSLLIVANVASR